MSTVASVAGSLSSAMHSMLGSSDRTSIKYMLADAALSGCQSDAIPFSLGHPLAERADVASDPGED